MERVLKHPEHGKRVISRESEIVCVYDGDMMMLDERIFGTEITAKSYEAYLLHYHADLGFKPDGI